MVPVEITGVVVHGKALGRKLGFPTLNLIPENNLGIPFGVYASKVSVGNKSYKGMTNIGSHPTVPDGSVTVETHIIDEDLDLYDERVCVTLLCFIRPEYRFETLDALIDELKKNRAEIKNWFAKNPL